MIYRAMLRGWARESASQRADKNIDRAEGSGAEREGGRLVDGLFRVVTVASGEGDR